MRRPCRGGRDVSREAAQSSAGSCIWHVVGLQRSIRDWTLRQGWGGRPVRAEQAQGIANQNSLEVAARRLHRYRPTLYRRNVLRPLDIDGPPFDSIGLMYVLHCLPGDLAAKAVVFDNLNAFLGPAAVLFGATILGGDVYANRAARKLMHIYNAKGILLNADDHLDALRAVLAETYVEVQIDVVGCVALFSVRRPKRVCLARV